MFAFLVVHISLSDSKCADLYAFMHLNFYAYEMAKPHTCRLSICFVTISIYPFCFYLLSVYNAYLGLEFFLIQKSGFGSSRIIFVILNCI